MTNRVNGGLSTHNDFSPESRPPLGLPDEMVCEIFTRLPLCAMAHVAPTCTKFAQIAKNPLIDLLYLDQELATKTTLSYAEITGYRERFQERYGRELSFSQIFVRSPCLETLDFSGSSVKSKDLDEMLRSAQASGCTVRHLILERCEEIVGPLFLGWLPQLESLDITGCKGITALHNLDQCALLKGLSMGGCIGIIGPLSLKGLAHLESLYISGCTGITALNDLEQCGLLKVLSMGDCTRVAGHLPLRGLVQLESLNITGCTRITALDDLGQCALLETLNMGGCTEIAGHLPLRGLVQLQGLDITGCTEITALDDLDQCVLLKGLSMGDCTGIAGHLPLRGLARLGSLNITGCTGITALLHLKQLVSLKLIDISGCAGLAGIDLSELPETTRVRR
jgi:hypothetical protein